MAGAEKDGTLLARIAAFPFIITLLDFSNFYGKVIAQQQEWVGGVAYQWALKNRVAFGLAFPATAPEL